MNNFQHLVNLLLPQAIGAAAHDGVDADAPVEGGRRQDSRVPRAPLDIKAPLRVRGQLVQYLGSKTKPNQSELSWSTLPSSNNPPVCPETGLLLLLPRSLHIAVHTNSGQTLMISKQQIITYHCFIPFSSH